MAETWATPELARQFWRDAPADDTVLITYLSAARVACLAFAPIDEEDWETGFGEAPFGGAGNGPYTGFGGAPEIPDNYLLAQIMQARNAWNSGKASPAGEFDGAGFGLSTMPLDWQVKQLLRPQRAIGAIA